MMLHAVIFHTNNHLPIRLPLVLVSCLLGREPTISEFEYFTEKEDSQILTSLRAYKHNPQIIKSFGLEFDDYVDCLKYICKYKHISDTNSVLSEICETIKTGFWNYGSVKNLSIMNMPTFDYYLSGDYNIDRELFI